ncbi:hypothetical protein FOJ82_12015 [Tessaracoccus rhinocerotis]|uniref:Lipoprotein n=1 Tax=Tessaracoccus rhinocerotis TaxID=1689449 RepID=A0A553JXU5_9ACTN|nr:hypothetical protein [Tessaracoccus rhinocerotis]TRY17275.1 hypothetical protein FOJ82_12015 [Tessaracoccus rhinocerotis]
MVKRRRMAALIGVVVVAGSLAACNQQNSSCRGATARYAECVIDTTSDGHSETVRLPFFIDPEKSGNDLEDIYDFNGVTDDVAAFHVAGQEYTCRQGDRLEVSRGHAECLVVEERRLKIKLWVGNPTMR